MTKLELAQYIRENKIDPYSIRLGKTKAAWWVDDYYIALYKESLRLEIIELTGASYKIIDKYKDYIYLVSNIKEPRLLYAGIILETSLAEWQFEHLNNNIDDTKIKRSHRHTENYEEIIGF